MTDGEALFRALCEQPREDTPRLAYADWLQENGQPERAELIRLQCEAWALCPAFPTPAAARTRASELLRAHRDRWDAELPALPRVEWGDMYVRGFVDSARVGRVETDLPGTLDRMFAAAPLRFLTVGWLLPGQLAELLAFPQLGRLTRLSVPGVSGRAETRLLLDAQARFPGTEIV
jgi:uncharacterized protein (TIGR02996 family)